MKEDKITHYSIIPVFQHSNCERSELSSCPNCGFEIAISEVLTTQIRERLKSELEMGIRKRETELLKREKQLSHAETSIDEQVAEKLKAETAEMRGVAIMKWVQIYNCP